MRSRTALACMSFALVAPLSFADDVVAPSEDSPKVVELKAKLAEVQARVAKELPKAEKAAAAAEKALPGLTKQLEQCADRAAAARSVCEDNCEETKHRCVKANYLRSNATQACKDRGEACSTKCSESSEKTCAALKAKEDNLSQTTRVPDQLRRELEEATQAIPWQQKREAEEEAARLKAEEEARLKAARESRFVVKDAGEYDGSGTGLVFDTKTNLHWLRFNRRGSPQSVAIDFCKEKGMRLPTKDEALEISKKSIEDYIQEKAWPSGWSTRTSTSAGAGLAWSVNCLGSSVQCRVDNPFHCDSYGALCVR